MFWFNVIGPVMYVSNIMASYNSLNLDSIRFGKRESQHSLARGRSLTPSFFVPSPSSLYSFPLPFSLSLSQSTKSSTVFSVLIFIDLLAYLGRVAHYLLLRALCSLGFQDTEQFSFFTGSFASCWLAPGIRPWPASSFYLR